MRIGVLAEDESDYEAVRVLIRRFAVRAKRLPPGTKAFVGKGCANLVRKATRVMNALSQEGCNAFVVVHDLDRTAAGLNDEAQLRQRLQAACPPTNIPICICIPIEELEAWFLACPKVMRHVTDQGGKDVLNPHLITKPKEHLHKLSRAANKRPRLSTNANKQLAEMLDLELCEQRCPALLQLGEFVKLVA